MNSPLNYTTKAQWLSFLEQAHIKEIDLGLSRISKVFESLKLPRPKKIFTCAGTNGKGSTLRMLELLALEQNMTVGKYTSPHLIDFNERIAINDQNVSDELLIQGLKAVYQAKGDISLTYFEYTTLVAFYLFAHLNLDIWLIEVGLGGRLDASNCIDADVSIVTSIALDHADWLGTDLDVIRFEKCGIGRSNKPLVLGQDVFTADLEQRLDTYFNPMPLLYNASKNFHWKELDENHFEIHIQKEGQIIEFTDLIKPKLPINNACCALSAWFLAGFNCDIEQMKAVLSQWKLAGRLTEIIKNDVTYTIDVGHNAHAAEFIAQQIPKQDVCILGMMADKDVMSVTQSLKNVAKTFIIVDLPLPRAIKKEKLKQYIDKPCITANSVQDALNKIDNMHVQSVLICGSFITCGLAFEVLEQNINEETT
ncbi:bifunctional folylpolyglutamate synthase/dihydrofolate synthase [Marinicellulosiphila megalodicopiae]|uniref:bifunctional folylpolyglutamate synthase/dihydrofolate synthase n=1 Tax=Marinicellulosiphila megalodicopiae TaxID=2724896 RepID=UPI003BB1BA4D